VGLGRLERPRSGDTPESLSRRVADEFPWGRGWPPPEGAGNYSDESRRANVPQDGVNYIDGYDDGFPTTAPVMSYAPNAFGIFDLGGNVWEWCEDLYSGEQNDRVVRGSSWYYFAPGDLVSSFRRAIRPDRRLIFGGFRVVVVSSASGR